MPATFQAPPEAAAQLCPHGFVYSWFRYQAFSRPKIGQKSVKNRSVFADVNSLVALYQ
jgi:hypothetical protein